MNDTVVPNPHDPGLQHQVDRLTAALRLWANRDESTTSPPQPEVTEAGNDALDAIDRLLRLLYELRSRLVGEYRAFAANRDRAWRSQHGRGPIDGGSGPFWTPNNESED